MSQSIRSHFYACDLRHIDMIQHLGHYCLDVDNQGFHNMSTPQFQMLIEFKVISKGFIPNIKEQYQMKELMNLAEEKIPLFVIYYAPGDLPEEMVEAKKHYSILEQGHNKKYTTYSDWSWMVQPLNKAGAEMVGNKAAKCFTMRQMYEWLCSINNVSVKPKLLSELSAKHSVEFKSFAKEVSLHI